MKVPPIDELLADAHVVALPMRVRFRGITTRELVLVRGPSGWGEFGAFVEYDDREAAPWLRSAIEAAWTDPPPPRRQTIPVNATVPAVAPQQVPEILARFPGATTAKVKVAEPGQTLTQDVARVNVVREHIPEVRVDANGAWSVDEAVVALDALTADGTLQYAEQPCRTVDELAELRSRLDGRVFVAADESIRRADDPLRVARAGGLDVAVVKVAPLGGMRRTLAVAEQLDELGIPVVVSSALESAVGMAAPLAAAAALPELPMACGLATGGLFAADVAAARTMRDGGLAAVAVEPDPPRLDALAMPVDRRHWWLDRIRRCHALLG